MARTGRYQLQDQPIPLAELPGAALRAVLKEGYAKADLKADVMAGVVVGVVALPLSMALSIAVGAPPQHGLYTAIVAGLFVALLGGSRTQVTGPTAAFIVVLAPIYAKHGLAGLLMAGLMGGVILILMGVLRLGSLIQFVPHPVTTGFTAGIATVIAMLQLKDVFGLRPASNPEHFLARVWAMASAWRTVSPWTLLVAGLTLAILILWPRVTRRVPPPMVALPLAAVAAALINWLVPQAGLDTIASRFQTVVGGQAVSGIPPLPPLPTLSWFASGPGGQPMVFGFDTLRDLLPGAFSIAMLGAIESLLSAVIADGMARTRHDPDAELLALGVGNLLCPFFGGIPATGALARTATNIRMGARSPVSAMVHALFVLLAVIALAPLIGYLPMAALAALLLLVAYNMSEMKHFGHIVRVAPKSDAAVLLTCFGLTVIFDMVIAVCVGIVLAALLFMRRMAEVAQARLIDEGHPAAPGKLPPGVVIYDISGPMFFGAAQRAMATLGIVDHKTTTVVLRLDGVPVMDATGLVALESALTELSHRGKKAIITGLQAQPRGLLQRARLLERPGLQIRDSLGDVLRELEAGAAAPAPAS
jgi:SulP family sulfate permease